MNTSYYFSHNVNARNDEKIMALRAEFGYEGYGLFWCLLEMMFENDRTALSHKLLKGIAYSHNIDSKLLIDIVKFCIEIELFYSDGDIFWNNSLRNRKGYMIDKREKKVAAGIKSGEIRKKKSSLNNNELQNEIEQNANTVRTELNKVKESTVNESKEKESIEKESKEKESGVCISHSYGVDTSANNSTENVCDITPPLDDINNSKSEIQADIELELSDTDVNSLFEDYPNLHINKADILAENLALYKAQNHECADKRALLAYLKQKLRFLEKERIKQLKSKYFSDFWDIYGVHQRKEACYKTFMNFTLDEIAIILRHCKEYAIANPEIRYRKNPLDYLKNKMWLEPIIYRNIYKYKGDTNNAISANENGSVQRGTVDYYRERLEELHYSGY